MQLRYFLKTTFRLLFLTALICTTVSCGEDNNSSGWDDSVHGTATISGIVMDTFNNPLSNVTITCMGTNTKRDVRMSATSEADGAFSIADVPSNARFISFSKEGFATVSYTIDVARFGTEEDIVLNPVLEFSAAIVTGRVLNASTGAPMQGVQVTCGTKTVTTDSDGMYRVEGLTFNDYTIKFSTVDGVTYSKSISVSDFSGDIATVPTIRLGSEDVFPSLKWQDLSDALIWYGNDYRGCTGYGGYNHWSVGYLSAMPHVGYFRYEAEGCSFQITESGGDEGRCGMTSEGDMDNLNGFMYGRKNIYEGNKVLNVFVRTHYGTAASPVYFGLQVLDMTAGEATAKKVGETYTHGKDQYASYSFDLSDYVGHEIAFAFGVYYHEGTYNHQLPIRRMCFGPTPVSGDDNLPGTFVTGLPLSWHMTVENASSMTLNDKTTFTGLNLGLNDSDGENGAKRVHNPGGQQGYSLWSGTNHLMMSWYYMYVAEIVEPVNAEGYTLLTRSGVQANYQMAESYIYSRFHISDDNDNLTIRVRNFSSVNPTVFRVTAITDSGVASALTPASYSANEAGAVANGNGCWQFIHDKGSGDPADYASFTYDLSSFRGQNIVIAVSIHKGETRADQQKLCFYSIEFGNQ